MEVWEFSSQLTAEHVVLKTRSESQPDCFLSVPAAQKSGAAFRQKGGGQRVNCLQLKTILMPYFGGFWRGILVPFSYKLGETRERGEWLCFSAKVMCVDWVNSFYKKIPDPYANSGNKQKSKKKV